MLPVAGHYVNIHAHRYAASGEEWVLRSMKHTEFPENESSGAAFSVGLHPWDIHQVDLSEVISKLDKVLDHPQVIALGETGLDKFARAALPMQQKAFTAQLELAVSKNMPVIIHAVKVNQELLEIKKDLPSSPPLIIHGFTGGAQLASSLVKAGFFLSLGEKLLTSPKIEEALATIGVEHVFLETDESDAPIKKIYDHASAALEISNEDLVEHMVEKVTRIFSQANGAS